LEKCRGHSEGAGNWKTGLGNRRVALRPPPSEVSTAVLPAVSGSVPFAPNGGPATVSLSCSLVEKVAEGRGRMSGEKS